MLKKDDLSYMEPFNGFKFEGFSLEKNAQVSDLFKRINHKAVINTLSYSERVHSYMIGLQEFLSPPEVSLVFTNTLDDMLKNDIQLERDGLRYLFQDQDFR